MEDKNISKILLSENNIRVPKGECFNSLSEALSQQERITTSITKTRLFIKPSTANYGLGITSLALNEVKLKYKQALDLAFKYSDSVIIEEYIKGEEYRFMVIKDECVAVCKRRAANVIGDGEKNIAELIREKNKDPRRGIGYTKPLEKIQLGDIEREFLLTQNLSFEDIPQVGSQIFIRPNSNVSTGGEAIDITARMPKYYKDLAIKASHTVGACICGVDIIIADEDINKEAKNYAVLELNFNPVLFMHECPYEGASQPVADKLLDALGF